MAHLHGLCASEKDHNWQHYWLALCWTIALVRRSTCWISSPVLLANLFWTSELKLSFSPLPLDGIAAHQSWKPDDSIWVWVHADVSWTPWWQAYQGQSAYDCWQKPEAACIWRSTCNGCCCLVVPQKQTTSSNPSATCGILLKHNTQSVWYLLWFYITAG